MSLTDLTKFDANEKQKRIKANFDLVATAVNELITDIGTFKTTFDNLLNQFNNRCFGNAGVAMSAGTKDQLKSTAAVVYAINGSVYTKAAADTLGAWTAGHTGLGNSEEAYYLLCLDASGTLVTAEGTIVAAAAGCVPPSLPADVAPIALVKIVTGASGTFVPDTTLLDDAGVTVTITDISNLVASTDAPVVAPSISSASL